MLARNSDAEGARNAIASLERNFNRWYHYPVLFLNNEPWDESFKIAMANVTSGSITFEVVPKHMWSFPDWIDEDAARRSIAAQAERGIVHAGEESYHHMCRFYSGFFYDHPALQKYKWFWRVEPDAQFTCAVTYDPFVEMEQRGKRYGYVVALWEVGRTAPSLFREATRFREMWMEDLKERGTWEMGRGFWEAMVDASWAPWPFRKGLRWFTGRNDEGDAWNFCHYWSNFEIADLDFFRGKEYRSFFDYLDRTGGFYFERVSQHPPKSQVWNLENADENSMATHQSTRLQQRCF